MIIDRRMGWDITDYGKGDFAIRPACSSFTVRNGFCRTCRPVAAWSMPRKS
jgi:D-lyxose ketol-isomerase